MTSKKTAPVSAPVNYAFVRDCLSAMSAREEIVAALTARKDALTADRAAKLEAFYEATAGGMIGIMQRAGSHESYKTTTDKLIAATVAAVAKVYATNGDQTHLDKAERAALATGRRYASRYFADADIEHPFPRAKKGTGKKAAAKAEKPAPAPKASAKVTAGAANVKPATGLKGADLDQNLREQLACFQRTFKGCAKDASEKARRAAELVAQAEKLLAAE